MVQVERRARKEIADRFYKTPQGKEVLEHVIGLNKERAKIQPTVYPFALRDFPLDEITSITGFSVKQVERAIAGFRDKGEENGGLRRPLREETIARKIHTVTGVKRGAPRQYTSDQLKTFALVKKLQETGLITNDLLNWNELTDLYSEHERPMPKDFASRLALEVFFTMRKAGTPARYTNIGHQVDRVWFKTAFQEEEDFIAMHSNTSLFGYEEDSEGLYDIDRLGHKWRPLIFDDDDLFDGHRAIARRKQMRERNEIPLSEKADEQDIAVPLWRVPRGAKFR